VTAGAAPQSASVPLGGTGVQVPDLALGTMNFGVPGRPCASEDGRRAVLNAYAEAGGNVPDTAPTYEDGHRRKCSAD
jgi:aryl-alcohol dehydrogenase-like predicted oxidoreductase